MEALNWMLVKTYTCPREQILILSLGLLDLTTNRLTLCSAGHPPILVRSANGNIEEVGEDIIGLPLGIAGSEYKHREIILDTGDVVVVYSAGVTDARNLREEWYDSRENRRLVRRLAETVGSPEVVGAAILQDVQNFLGDRPPTGDITLICFGPHVQENRSM
jgi:serine phosphatase RsbU (regulator of sigma subunit)